MITSYTTDAVFDVAFLQADFYRLDFEKTIIVKTLILQWIREHKYLFL